MSQQFISSVLIEKLGHNLEEIRQRALFNIISKLDNGVLFDNDLARSKELIIMLLNWFLFEPCRNEDLVLSLLKRILKSENGKIVINNIGKTVLLNKLHKIRSYLHTRFHPQLEEIINIVNQFETTPVPPLEFELPLSYRSSEGESSRNVGTTATPFEGFTFKSRSTEQQTGVEILSANTPSPATSIIKSKYELPNNFFTWQPLVESDRHILDKIENSLTSPDHPAALLHSCEFFSSVLLQDFPAEVFLQRPSIIREFYNLMNCGSSRIIMTVLNCLIQLTDALNIRISHCNEMSLRNHKSEVLLIHDCGSSTTSAMESTRSSEFEKPSQIDTLQKKQMSTITFSFTTISVALNYLKGSKISQECVNLCFYLLEEILQLLEGVIKSEMWESTDNFEVKKVLKGVNEALVKYGDTVEHFRLESSLNENVKLRAIYLCLVYHCCNFINNLIPTSKSELIFPKIFKTALSNSLLDTTLGQLYPNLHQIILNYIEVLNRDVESLRKYKDVTEICRGMSATIKFIREHNILDINENLVLTSNALPSISFHESFDFIKICVDVFSEQLPPISHDFELTKSAEEVVLFLLGHNLERIRLEMYKLCHKKVITTIGPNLNRECSVPGSQVLFLLTSKVFAEIANFGLTSHNETIKTCAEDILTYILKSKMLVCETVWSKVIRALEESLPILTCFARKTTTIGKTLLNLIDPDTSKLLQLPTVAMVKSNIELLYFDDCYLREEGFSRICWLLSTEQNSRDLLPKINSLYDSSLSNISRLRSVVDINKIRHNKDHFYQASSLKQVLEVLNSNNVEPGIRRSALNQISVMLEDCLLHETFLDSNGLKIVNEIFKNSLVEKDYKDYPDSVVPIVSILKNLCLYNSLLRNEMSEDLATIFCILRSLFLFFTEERLKQDASVLLFLLIFKNFIKGTPSQGNFSLPDLIKEKLSVPFQCNFYSKNYKNDENIKELILSDRWCLSSIQIHWNMELFDGFQNLTKLNEVDYSKIDLKFSEILKLNNYDLNVIKNSSVHHCIREYLNMIQSGTSHGAVLESIQYLHLYTFLYKSNENEENLIIFPWETSFYRFFKSLPSCEDDATLLKSILIFLQHLTPLYKNKIKNCWITTTLNSSKYCLLDLINSSNLNNIARELLTLITICAKDQCYLKSFKNQGETHLWFNITKIIIENLKSNNTEHFYNLAYLDSLLSCLVHLTARLGWSGNSQDLIPELLSYFWELLHAFHKGKGESATISVMGLSITRRVVLILNHVVMEMQFHKIKNWETTFFGDFDRDEIMLNFVDLLKSRDVIVRAAISQLFSSLATSIIINKTIINEIKIDKYHMCELALMAFSDQTEAAIVRENAVKMLGNFAAHCTALNSKVTLKSTLKKSSTLDLFSFIDDYNFYTILDVTLNRLFTLEMSDVRKYTKCIFSSETSSTSDGNGETSQLATTPGLIHSSLDFLYNILHLDAGSVSRKIQQLGLVKLIFRALCNPAMAVSTSTELMLYCDILEMDITICLVLTKLAESNPVCLGTILHTKDCFNLLISLLNPRAFVDTDQSQLVYLRNKLWTEIFNLISGLLLESSQKLSGKNLEATGVVVDAIWEVGVGGFFEAVYESLGNFEFNDLQNSAMIFLTTLFQIDIFGTYNSSEDNPSKSLLKNLLDSTECSKTVIINNSIRKDQQQSNILEECYFGNIEPTENDNFEMSLIETEHPSTSGKDLCKILLYLNQVCTYTPKYAKKQPLVINALSGLLCLSQEAKTYALNNKFLSTIVKHLKNYHMKLSVESVDNLRRLSDKKRICPVLEGVNDLVVNLNNFMLNDVKVKEEAARLNVADVVHKLWVWFLFEKNYLGNVLKLICTFTTKSQQACQSLLITTTVGLHPRKTPGNDSLLHAIIHIINKQMELTTKTHDLKILEISLNILGNCCETLECRIQISKSDLFNGINRMHPALTKHQKPWENVEHYWLNFLEIFTAFPEGQTAVAKSSELLEIIIAITHNSKYENRHVALKILRNLSFYQSNRLRLLSSVDFINILRTKLIHGNASEKMLVVVIIWALVANNQKGKIVLKSARIDQQLINCIKQSELLSPHRIDCENLEKMRFVLNMLIDGEKC